MYTLDYDLCFTDVYSSLKTTSSHNLHTTKQITSKNPCSCVFSVIVNQILDLTPRIQLTVWHHQLDFGTLPLASQRLKCHPPLMFIFYPNLFLKWVLAYSIYDIIFMTWYFIQPIFYIKVLDIQPIFLLSLFFLTRSM